MLPWPATAFPVDAQSSSLEVSIEPVDRLPQALRPEWQLLEQEAAEPNSFAEWWFADASLRHLAPQQPVRLALVRRGGSLIGAGLFHCAADYGRAKISHVENWTHCNQFAGMPLVRRGEEAAFWKATLAALDGAAWAPGFLHLTKMVEGGPLHHGLEVAASVLGRSCDVVHRCSRAFLETRLCAKEYLARNLAKKRRSELSRRRKRLAEQGHLETRALIAAEEIGPWCEEFLTLERSGWKGKAGSALACSPARAAFFRDVVAAAHEAGRLHFLRLDLDGRAVAMLTAFIAPPGAYGFKTCFDESYARFSPGALLQIDNLGFLTRPDIRWTDSCSAAEHPMMNSLWSERRSIVRLTVRLAGARRLTPYAAACAIDRGSAALRTLHRNRADD